MIRVILYCKVLSQLQIFLFFFHPLMSFPKLELLTFKKNIEGILYSSI